jgi:hypothetical protein
VTKIPFHSQLADLGVELAKLGLPAACLRVLLEKTAAAHRAAAFSWRRSDSGGADTSLPSLVASFRNASSATFALARHQVAALSSCSSVCPSSPCWADPTLSPGPIFSLFGVRLNSGCTARSGVCAGRSYAAFPPPIRRHDEIIHVRRRVRNARCGANQHIGATIGLPPRNG